MKGQDGRSSVGKREAKVARRSDMEYYSSLQTAASHLKLQTDSDLASSHLTSDQRRHNHYLNQLNEQTELGRKNKQEQVLATGFLV